jgi:hypothetical protein
MQTYVNNAPFYPANSAPTPNGYPIGNQPPRFSLPTYPNMQPNYYYGDCGIQFGAGCNDSVEHIIRGLNSAMGLLLDPCADRCKPNIPSHHQASWCNPPDNYTKYEWNQNNYYSYPQHIWVLDDKCKETTKHVSKKFSDFFCR